MYDHCFLNILLVYYHILCFIDINEKVLSDAVILYYSDNRLQTLTTKILDKKKTRKVTRCYFR